MVCVVLLILSLGLLKTTNEIFVRKTGRSRLATIIDPSQENPGSAANDVDIFFVGTSCIMDGVIPMELWRSRGYTSQILCSEYNDMDRNIMMLRLALQYKKPKLVVLDVRNFWEKSDPDNVIIGYQEYSDAFPLTAEKVKATFDLYEDSATRIKLLFPFYIYHNRWNDLKSGDFRKNSDSFKYRGYELSKDVKEIDLRPPMLSSAIPGEGDIPELPSVYGIEAITEFVSFARSQGIEVAMLVLPFEADEFEQSYLLSLMRLSLELNVPYINMLEMPGIMDPERDFKDGEHLNYYGALKATELIGSFIEYNYEIPDHREDSAYSADWDYWYKKYKKSADKD